MRRYVLFMLTLLVISLPLCLSLACLAGDGKWTKKTDMPTPRGWLATCAVNGRIYAIGGYAGGTTVSSAVEEYDPVTDTWTKKADMPTARDGLSAVAVNGKIYVIGGLIEAPMTFLSTVEEYDPVTDTWTKKADMPTPRVSLSTGVVNGKIYAIGGFSRVGMFHVEEYDPVSDTWTTKSNIPTPRGAIANNAPTVNEKIYVIGGWATYSLRGPAFSTVEEYDPVTDTWTKKADMQEAKGYLGVNDVNGKIYAIGGTVRGDTALSTVEEYDPVADKWAKKPDMPTERWYFSTSAVNGKIYVIGGCRDKDGNVLTSIVEEYDVSLEGASVEAKGKLATLWGRVKK